MLGFSPQASLPLDTLPAPGPVTNTFTKLSNARILKTGSFTKLSNTRIKVTQSVTKLSNARILKTGSFTKLSNTTIFRTMSLTKTSDARIKKTGSFTKLSDARVVLTGSFTKTSDARILKTQSFTKLSNARVLKTQSFTKLSDTRIKKMASFTKLSDARIKKTQSFVKLSDTRIKKTQSLTKTSDARIRLTNSFTKTSDARVRKTQQLTKLSNARILKTLTFTKTANSRIKVGQSFSKLSDTRIKRTGQLTLLSGAMILNTVAPAIIRRIVMADMRLLKVISVNNAYQIRVQDDVILADTTGGAFTVMLPPAYRVSEKEHRIKLIGSNPLSITSAYGSIDGNSVITISTPGGYYSFVSDKTDWHVLTPSITIKRIDKPEYIPELYVQVETKIRDYQVGAHDDVILADTTAGGFTVTLPLPTKHREFRVKLIKSSNAVVVQGTGMTPVVIGTMNDAYAFISDGTAWYPIKLVIDYFL